MQKCQSRRVLILPMEVIESVKKLMQYQQREAQRIGSKWEEHNRLFTQWNDPIRITASVGNNLVEAVL